MPVITSILSRPDKNTLLRLRDIYTAHGHELRFVGGVVRDALLNRQAADIDLATPLPPEQGLALLKSHNINVVAPGLQFGTITAIVNGQAYEITTLRKDISTDGRHAIVIYTDDWCLDAQRRDFTINGLYADFDGNIFDYVGGVEDLKQGIVRFIGDVSARITEDYLRIIRLFRFHAWYGEGDIEKETLALCQQHASHLNKLSKERITKELLKLLSAPTPFKTLKAMAQYSVLSQILPNACFDEEVFMRLQAIEGKHHFVPHPLLRLSLLTDSYKNLRLSRQEELYLKTLLTLTTTLEIKTLYLSLYLHGKELILNALLRQAVLFNREIDAFIDLIQDLEIPPFPVTGKVLIEAGIEPDKSMGALLQECLEWWCYLKYTPTLADCLHWIQNQTGKPN